MGKTEFMASHPLEMVSYPPQTCDITKLVSSLGRRLLGHNEARCETLGKVMFQIDSYTVIFMRVVIFRISKK